MCKVGLKYVNAIEHMNLRTYHELVVSRSIEVEMCRVDLHLLLGHPLPVLLVNGGPVISIIIASLHLLLGHPLPVWLVKLGPVMKVNLHLLLK